MSKPNRKWMRIITAAFAALLLVLSAAGGINTSAAIIQTPVQWQDYFRQSEGPGRNPADDGAGGEQFTKAPRKYALRHAGSRGAGSLACLEALASGGWVYYDASPVYTSPYDKTPTVFILSLAAHGCRAPPAFSSCI